MIIFVKVLMLTINRIKIKMNIISTEKLKDISNKLFSAVAIFTLLAFSLQFALLPNSAQALQVTSRKLTLGSSAPSASTTYTFDFTTATTATFQSFQAQICDAASGTCNAPAGLTTTSSTFDSTSLSGTWSVSNGTAGSLRGSATGAASTTNGSARQVVFGAVTNPSATNTTYYARITLFSDTGWATPVDTGTVAASTATAIDLTATVDETLTFCSGTSGITTSSCSGATGSTVAFGTLSPSATNSGASQLGVGTNGLSGFVITVNGATLTSGGNTVSALAAQTASTTGAEQFGLNLRDNATPNIGTDPDGSGTAAPTANYNTVDSYRFVTGDSIASKGTSDQFRRFHAAYIVNINTATEAGAYTATLTYIATATF